MGLTLFFVLALLAGTQAGPIQEVVVGGQCSKTCTESNQFKYEPGTTYEYTYDNGITTAIQGASEDHAGFHMTATVSVEFISKCEAVMRVKDVTLEEHDPETSTMKVASALLGKLLEENPVRISYQDGNIEELCLSAPELPEVVNIKRGILSVFQIGMSDVNVDETVTEDDVSGKCETNYTSTKSGWYDRRITRTKNLLGCGDRHDYRSSVQGIPYNSNSKIQTLPLVKSTHECQHDISGSTGRLTSVMCEEQHVLAPFSRQNSGAVTNGKQKLTYIKEHRSKSNQVPVKSRTTLKFDHTNGQEAEPTIKDVESKLMEICASTKQGVKPETPSLFKSLVNMMKSIDASSMSAVYKKIKSKNICSANNERVRKFFLDAAPLTGTKSGLTFMVEMLQDNEVNGLQADMWLTTLAFLQEPTMDMLTTVKPLLYLKSNTEKAMLAVSSLVHTLCKNNQECENSLPVRKVIAVLESKIGNCKVSRTNFDTVLGALRAIGNAGFGTSAIPTLAKCIKISNNPIEIRLSAIEAFNRIPCTANKQPILTILTDMDADSEIRIATYKSLMSCPSADILSKVKNILANEDMNQVGSYIWSHLTNLMETSDPHKQSIRAILEDERLQKEFNLDNRKFSRNYEKSLFIEKLNTGVTAEGDLIWSSNSFIPRSAMVNLTVDLFGNAVNLFEVGGRVEGLEYFLESYFGPNGYFSEQDVQAAASEKAVDAIKADKSSKITKRMNSVMDELRGSMYMKVFGNELRYMNFQGLDSLMFGNKFDIMDVLAKLSKENSYQFTQSTTFLDSSVIIPTSSGFPMNLTVNGTATIDLQASGKVDVMKLAQNNLDIHGLIRPSSAVEVSSSMSVDGFVTKIGIKMVSTMHSRTSVQGKISLTEEKALNVEFDLPEEQMDIFSVKSSFFTVHRDLEREQSMITQNRQTRKLCTGYTPAKITGLELCGEISFPNASLVEDAPYFPITGPVNMGISLHKRDSLAGYKLQAKSVHTQKTNIIQMAFSTPGSNVDRSFTLDFNLNKADKTFETSFSSPWKKADFKGTVTYARNLKEIHGKFNWDGSVRYEVKATLASEKSGPGMVYTPTVTIQIPNRKPMGLSGSIKYAPWKLFDSELALIGIKATPIRIQASLMNKQKLVKASVSLQLERKQAYTADASMQKIIFKKKVNYKPLISIRTPSSEVFAFGGNLVHTYGKNLDIQATIDKIVSQPVILKAKIVKKAYRKGRELYNVKMDLRSKLVDVKLKTKFDNRNMKTIATDIDVTYVIRKVARDNIKLVSKVINLSSNSLTKAKASVNLASKRSPQYNFKMMGNVNHNKKHSEMDADIFYGKNFKDVTKQISLSAGLDRALKSWKQSALKFNGQFRKGKDIKVVGKINHAHTKSSLENSVSFRINGDGVSSTLTLKDASKTLKNMEGNLEISIPGKTVSISQSIIEEKANKFTSTMKAQMGKSKNVITTKWETLSPNSLLLSSKLDLIGMETIFVGTEYTLSPELYNARGAFSHGKSNYSSTVSVKFPVSGSIQVSADLECPNRRVVAEIEGKKDGSSLFTQVDLRWNADRDDTERVILSGNVLSPNMKNIDGSIAIQHPAITLGINLRHSVGSKYASKLEVQVDNSQFFLVDTAFGSYTQKKGTEMVGTIDLKTPINSLKSINIKMTHGIEDSKYETNIDMKWTPKNVISSTLKVKRPLSPRHLNIELIAKTPFKAVKNIHASLINKLNDGMNSVARLNWNKQSVQVDVTLANRGDSQKTDLQGQINLKTSYRSLKDGTITVTHTSGKGSCKSEASIRMNKKEYGIESTMRYRINDRNVRNNGKVTISSPSDKIVATWNHQNTPNNVDTSSEITWGKKHASIKYSGLQEFTSNGGRFSSALDLQLPIANFKDVVFQVNHEHKSGQVASNIKLESNRNMIAFADAKYLNENGEVTSSLSLTNPLYDGEISAKISSVYNRYPMNGHLEVAVTPLQTVTVDATFNRGQRGNTDASLTLTTPMFDPVTLTGSRIVKNTGVESSLSAKYATSKQLNLVTVHKLGQHKMFKATFTSPYTEVYTSELDFVILPKRFTSSASLEAEPFIPKISAEINGDVNDGLTGNMKVTSKVSYSEASIESKELSNGDRKSTVSVEYQPGKIVKMVSSYRLDRLNDLKMDVEVNTPFTTLPYSALRMQHRGDSREFNNNVELEYSKGNKVTGMTTFSTRNGLEGTISLRSPFADPVDGAFRHSGSLSNFNTHLEVSKYTADLSHRGNFRDFTSELKLSDGENEMKGSTNFAYDPKLNTAIVFETPFKNWESTRLSFTFDGTLSKFTQDTELFVSRYGNFKLDTSMDITHPLSISLNLKTPIKGFNNMAVSMSHSGTFNKFVTQIKARRGSSAYEGIVKFNSQTAINLELSLKTPFKNYRQNTVSMTFDGELDSFKSNLEFQRNKDISEIDLAFTFKRKLDIDLTIRSPYMDPVKASVDHWGSMKKFNTKVRARFGKEKLISDIRFQTSPSFNAFVSLKTPFRMLKNQQLTLKHAGNKNSFKCNVDYRCNSLNYNGDLTFQNLNKMRGELNLKGSNFKPMKAILSHEGPVHNFKSSGEVSVGKKVSNIAISLKAVDGLKSSIQIQTPIKGFESMQASYAHSGPSNNFRCHGEAALNKKRGQVDLMFDVSRDISMSVSLNTPFDGLNEVSSSFTHAGDMNSFNTGLVFDNNGNTLEGSVVFSNLRKLTGSASLRSTFPGITNTDASFEHSGNVQKFKTHAELNYGQQKSATDVSFSSLNGYRGKASVETPYKSMATAFEHETKKPTISSSTYLTVDGVKMYDLKSVVATSPSFSASINLQTPVQKFESTEVTFNHDGSLDTFRSQMSLVFAGERGAIDLSFETSPNMQARFSVKSSLFKPLEISTSHSGALTNFKSALECSYGRESQISTEVTLNVEGPIAGSFQMISPHLRNIKTSFKHQGGIKNFNSDAEMVYAGKRNHMSLAFRMQNEIEGVLTVTTPLMKRLDIQVNSVGKLSTARTRFNILYGGDSKFNLNAEWNFNTKMTGEISMQTPVQGFTNMLVKFDHTGDWNNFDTDAKMSLERKSIGTNIHFSPSNGKLTINTPFADDVIVQFTFFGNLLDHVASTRVNYGTKEVLDVDSKLTFAKHTVESGISIRSPVTGPIATSLTISGNSMNRFSVLTSLMVDNDKHEAELLFSKIDDITGSAALRSPSMKPVSTTFTLKSDKQSMSAEGNVVFGSEKHELEASLRRSNGIETGFSLRSPLLVPVSARFDLKGNTLNKIETSGGLMIDRENHEFDMSFNRFGETRATLNLRSPAMVPISLEFNFNGDITSFDARVEATVDSENHKFDMAFNRVAKTSGSVNLKSPFVIPVSLSFTFNGDSRRFNAEATATIDSEKHVVDMSFNRARKTSGTFNLNSPAVIPISAVFNMNGDMNTFDMNAEITIDSDKHAVDTSFNTIGERSATLNIKSPAMIPVTISINNKGNIENFATKAKAILGEDTHSLDVTFNGQDEHSGTFNLNSPSFVPVSVSFNVKREANLFQADAKATIDSETHTGEVMINTNNGIEGSYKLSTPVFMPMSGNIAISGGASNFRSNMKFLIGSESFEGDLTFSSDKITKGSLRLMPLMHFGNVEASLEHAGSINNFRTHAELSLNNNNLATTDLAFNVESAMTGMATIVVKDVTGTASFDHTGTFSSFRNVLSLEYNSKSMFDSTVTFNIKPLKFDFTVKTPMENLETISGQFKHSGNMLNFKNHAEINIAGDKTEADMSCNFASKLAASMSAKSAYFPTTSASFDISSSHGLKFDIDFSYGKSKYSVEGSLNTKDQIEAGIIILTPIQGYRNIVAKLTHKGPFPEINSVFDLRSGRRTLASTSIVLSRQSGLTARLFAQSVLTPMLQLTVQHNGQLDNFNTNAEMRLNGKPFTTVASFKSLPKPEGSISITTPYTSDIFGSFNLDFNVPSAKFISSYGAKSVSGYATTVSTRNTFGGKAGFETPFEGFENVDGSMTYSDMYRGIKVNAELGINAVQKFEFDTESSWRNGLSGKVTLKTPYSPLRHTSADFKIEGTFPNVKSEMNAMHSNEKYTLVADVKHELSTSAEVTVSTPISGYESMGLKLNHQGPISNMKTTVKLLIPNNELIEGSFTNMMTESRLQTQAKLETPYIEDLSFDLELSGKPSNFRNVINLSMGSSNNVKSQTSMNFAGSTLNIDTTLSSVISGVSDEQKATVKYIIGDNSEVSANARLFGSVYSFESSLQLADNINGMVSLRTPLPTVRDVSLTFSHSGNQRRFTSKAALQYAPGKVIGGTVEYVKYGWRRLQTSLELQTPFIDFENTKVSYTHSASVDSFECDGSLSVMDNDFSGNFKASRSPMSTTLKIKTPLERFEEIGATFELSKGNMLFDLAAGVTYMTDTSISFDSKMDLSSSPKKMSVVLSTPFPEFSYAELKLSNAGDMNGFHTMAHLVAPYINTIRAEAEGQMSSLSSMAGTLTVTSHFKNFENLKFSIKNSAIRAKYSSRFQASWSESETIVIDGSFKDTKSSMGADISIDTPFSSFRKYNLKTGTTVRGSKYSQSFFSKLNGYTQADLDMSVDIGDVKSTTVVMRAPVAIETSLLGEKRYNTYSGSAIVSVMQMTYKLESTFDTDSNKLTVSHQCPENRIQLESTFNTIQPNANIVINGARYGYDARLQKDDLRLKAILPSRSILVAGSQKYRTTEASFMWDADRDETKKVGFRSVMSSSKDSMKADVTLMLPTLGKDIQLDSEMIVNSGRVIFDGKTELSYSNDRRKKFTISSRLADISNEWSMKNYSFSFGISHPYSSVGVQLNSHIAKSNSKYTGGIDLEYLTVGRQTKTFSVNGELNKLRKTVDFEMNTPMKTVAVSGSASNKSPFVVVLKNKYDNKRPLNTRIDVDTAKKSLSFQMNYDLDNPESEFHVSAQYVNSTAVSAEVFHIVNRQRVTDVLTTVRLNNSHLLHSRLHWRPAMINDLKGLINRKSNSFQKQMSHFVRDASKDINYEMSQKYRLVFRELSQEIDFDTLYQMYESNEYYLRDTTEVIVSLVADMEMMAKDTSVKMINSIDMRVPRQLAQMAADNYNSGLVYMADSVNSIYHSGLLKNMTNSLPDVNIQQRYNDYIDYVYKMKSIPHQYVGESYGPAMENAVAIINSKVNGYVLQQGKNAFNYWEVKENTQMLVDAIVEWMKEEINAEISDIKATILNLKRSTITVYDPKHGEIQAELRLPFPVKSLEELPVVDVTPLIYKYKSYTPSMPSITLPSTDISSWVPPFDGYASIQGDTITTFDGLTYDLTKRCTFILARDFVDGNFSAVLNNDENGKSVILLTRGMSIEIKSNGTVLVNGLPSVPEYPVNGISIKSNDDQVTVDGAGSFEVSYNKDYNLYTFRMNGWYFGKVGGLFGTYDNEPTNDLMTSYGKEIRNSDRFTSTWDVGTVRCR